MHQQYRALLQGVCDRTSPVMELLKEIVTDVWKQRYAESDENRQRIESRITKLETRKKKLLDAYLDGHVDQDTFDEKKAELEAQMCLAKCGAHDEQLEHLDIQAVLAAAEFILRDAGSLWDRLELKDKRRLSELLFPEGVVVDKEKGLRTLGNNVLIDLCDLLADGDKQMAPPRGIEPRSSG